MYYMLSEVKIVLYVQQSFLLFVFFLCMYFSLFFFLFLFLLLFLLV